MQVNERKSVVVLNMGKYVGTATDTGCYCKNPCCLSEIEVSTATTTTQIEKVKIADGNGNPLLISAVITFKVTSPAKAVLEVFMNS